MGPSIRCWNGTTSALQPEEITLKGSRSFMCILSIKVPIQKKSLETYLMILIDRVRSRARGSSRCESSLVNFIARHDLVDRFPLNHPGRETWAWLDSSS